MFFRIISLSQSCSNRYVFCEHNNWYFSYCLIFRKRVRNIVPNPAKIGIQGCIRTPRRNRELGGRLLVEFAPIPLPPLPSPPQKKTTTTITTKTQQQTKTNKQKTQQHQQQQNTYTHTPTKTRARAHTHTHARARTHTHARTHARTVSLFFGYSSTPLTGRLSDANNWYLFISLYFGPLLPPPPSSRTHAHQILMEMKHSRILFYKATFATDKQQQTAERFSKGSLNVQLQPLSTDMTLHCTLLFNMLVIHKTASQ